jgi:AraC family transcriptional regulator
MDDKIKKQKTKDDYYKRIDKIIKYIHENLDGNLSLEHLSGIACFAPYHFHRIFQSIQGKTLKKYIRKVKLQRSTRQLIESEMLIERIAKKAGYDNIDSFIRRFTEDYGLSPKLYRKQAKLAINKMEQSLNGINNTLDVEIKELKDIIIASMDYKGDYKKIVEVFDRMIAYMKHKNLMTPKTRAFAIYHDDSDAVELDKLRSSAGFTVSDDFKDDGEVKKRIIPAGTYACIIYQGPYAGLEKVYKWFYGNWLVNSRYDIDHAPPIEEYLNDPSDTQPSEIKTIIYIGLK